MKIETLRGQVLVEGTWFWTIVFTRPDQNIRSYKVPVDQIEEIGNCGYQAKIEGFNIIFYWPPDPFFGMNGENGPCP